MLTSPSIEGILRHDSVVYDGLQRPIEIIRAFDSPSSETDKMPNENEHEVLDQYFHDLYGIFMKKLSYFVVESNIDSIDTVKLQAMLQELIKVKKIISRRLK